MAESTVAKIPGKPVSMKLCTGSSKELNSQQLNRRLLTLETTKFSSVHININRFWNVAF